MDVTSGAAVAALLYDLFDVKKSTGSDEENGGMHHNDVQVAPWRVLDLCCAPGYVSCPVLYVSTDCDPNC